MAFCPLGMPNGRRVGRPLSGAASPHAGTTHERTSVCLAVWSYARQFLVSVGRVVGSTKARHNHRGLWPYCVWICRRCCLGSSNRGDEVTGVRAVCQHGRQRDRVRPTGRAGDRHVRSLGAVVDRDDRRLHSGSRCVEGEGSGGNAVRR